MEELNFFEEEKSSQDKIPDIPEILLPICFRNKILKFLKAMKKETHIEYEDLSDENTYVIITKFSPKDFEVIFNYQDKLLGIDTTEE